MLARAAGVRQETQTYIEGELCQCKYGQILHEALRREGIELEELEAALREHGVSMPEQVASAVLEIDGTISVVPFQGHTVRKMRHVKSSRNR